ncbi:protein involved in polysaccharide export with SLBB domain [Mangrovibacterium marinum]|uniref:Protein involved in polysaccharide export with SLBB domain n=1 Tax=Mangrovibacterium marinum TaxID=1639118 RepID=A0A2T5C0A6_9BACT|nr:SLBB domain-containing protein [Mangrovibacterium marinum]PTN08000.1 protein involved in polysaccharide export with SLBB domain [Mangrovibacterium marinum]
MFRSLTIILIALFLSGFLATVSAQTDISTVQVENLSDAQINQIAQQIRERGLTVTEAVSLARAKGASQQQIDQLMSRLQQVQNGSSASGIQAQQSAAQTTEEVNFTDDQPSAQKTDHPGTLKNRRVFGYKLFNQDQLSFEPSANIPVPNDYVVGIGDQLTVNVWGASQQNYQLVVDNNGAVNIPDLGPVQVARQDFASVRTLLIRRLSAIYSGMAGDSPNTFAEVSINNLRSIKVNVIGEAITPGTYTLPATASAFNALYLSGGPNENGSFRSIRIIRNNKQIAEIDAYDYLLNSNTQNNLSLRDQDVIFIPTYHKRVETVGAFKREAIFELKEGENINKLIDYAGGFSEKAAQSRLLITRNTEDGYKLDDVQQNQYPSYALKNGDIIRAEELIDVFENRVSIDGAVYRPGTYALDTNTHLSDLLTKAGGLIPNYFAERGLIIRLDEKFFPTTIAFDVNEVLSGKNDPLLQREDQILIRDIYSIGEQKTIRIYGEIMQAGEFSFYKNMTLKDLIFIAGGMKEAASESYIEVARRNSYEDAANLNNKMVSLYSFAISRDLKLTDEDENFVLQPFDQVYVRRAPSYESQKTVTILGEVKYPGQYSISSKNERISDLLKRAGGLTPYAFKAGAHMTRKVDRQAKEQLTIASQMHLEGDSTLEQIQEISAKTLELQLESILNRPGSDNDYTLKEGDEIYIPVQSEEIWVNGEVMNPAGLAFQKGKNAKYYINSSGGFSTEAKKDKVYVIYANGSSASTKTFFFRKYPKVEPGSQIIVPQKPKKEGMPVGTWLAIASTFSSIAVAIVAVLK